MFLRPSATADADHRGRVAIEQSQVSLGTTVIKGAVEISRCAKLALHFGDQLKCAQAPRLGDLAKIHADVVVTWRRMEITRKQLLARGNPFLSNLNALGVIGREVR